MQLLLRTIQEKEPVKRESTVALEYVHWRRHQLCRLMAFGVLGVDGVDVKHCTRGIAREVNQLNRHHIRLVYESHFLKCSFQWCTITTKAQEPNRPLDRGSGPAIGNHLFLKPSTLCRRDSSGAWYLTKQPTCLPGPKAGSGRVISIILKT